MPSLQLSGFFLNGRVQVMLEARRFIAVDFVFLIVCVSVDHITGYTKYPKISRVHSMNRAVMSTVVSVNWNWG